MPRLSDRHLLCDILRINVDSQRRQSHSSSSSSSTTAPQQQHSTQSRTLCFVLCVSVALLFMMMMMTSTSTCAQESTSAPIKGELVPSWFKDHPLAGYPCFFGLDLAKLDNCTCTEPNRQRLRPREHVRAPVPASEVTVGCHGPRCNGMPQVKTKTRIAMDYNCNVTDSSLDCRGNDAGNRYVYDDCEEGIHQQLNLWGYEFRFESLSETGKTVVTCPLKRSIQGSALAGYTLAVGLRVRRVKDGSHFRYVSQILGCNSTAIETQEPSNRFLQKIEVDILP